ncbi:hypothetical protein [Okeania sp. SIO3B5]|nr:hypothetical protein [Okeania sp. SIO3B5]
MKKGFTDTVSSKSEVKSNVILAENLKLKKMGYKFDTPLVD